MGKSLVIPSAEKRSAKKSSVKKVKSSAEKPKPSAEKRYAIIQRYGEHKQYKGPLDVNTFLALLSKLNIKVDVNGIPDLFDVNYTRKYILKILEEIKKNPVTIINNYNSMVRLPNTTEIDEEFNSFMTSSAKISFIQHKVYVETGSIYAPTFLHIEKLGGIIVFLNIKRQVSMRYVCMSLIGFAEIPFDGEKCRCKNCIRDFNGYPMELQKYVNEMLIKCQ
jgi:hypothetical protein